MKMRHIVPLAALCVLLTGCSQKGGSEKASPEVYAGLFYSKAQTEAETEINERKNAANATENNDGADADNAGGSDDNMTAPTGAREAAPDNTGSDGDTTAPEESAGGSAEESVPQGNTSGSAPAQTEEPVKTIGNRQSKTVTYTSDQAVADLQIGDICFFPYKTDSELYPQETSEETSDTSTSGSTSSDTSSKPPKKEKTYNYGYKVVFRTETDTYLLAVSPYDTCEWDEINDMCLEIASRFKSTVQMLGAPSREDLKYFTSVGIYLPGQYEMWTSTLTTEAGGRAYFRNTKGAFNSGRDVTKDCGVCAIIKVTAPQSNAELLSSELSFYEEAKARLEREEEQFKTATAEGTDSEGTSSEGTSPEETSSEGTSPQ